MTSKPSSLFHLVQPPRRPSEGKPPLLLLLHGVGSNEQDLFSRAPMLDPRLLVVSARGPITLYPGAYAWYHVTFTYEGPVHRPGESEESRKKLITFLDEIVDAYDADPQRVYVGGFSQGGAMTFCLATTVPEKLAGALILSGRTIEEMADRMAPTENFHQLPGARRRRGARRASGAPGRRPERTRGRGAGGCASGTRRPCASRACENDRAARTVSPAGS